LSLRWFTVRETRVVESSDAVNYSYFGGVLTEVKTENAALGPADTGLAAASS
jgi:hypothetical protein